MTAAWKNACCLLAVLIVVGCRKDEAVNNVGIPGFTQHLSFSATGVSGSSRTYSRISASYNSSTNETTIETLDDSTTAGKFILRFHGGTAGMYVYNVKGSPLDVDQVYMRFVPSYTGTSPSGVFELTGVPDDSLEAEVIIQHYGTVRDSITGEFSAFLRLTAPVVDFKTLVHSGSFTVRRLN
jgi:hypothetical protein